MRHNPASLPSREEINALLAPLDGEQNPRQIVHKGIDLNDLPFKLLRNPSQPLETQFTLATLRVGLNRFKNFVNTNNTAGVDRITKTIVSRVQDLEAQGLDLAAFAQNPHTYARTWNNAQTPNTEPSLKSADDAEPDIVPFSASGTDESEDEIFKLRDALGEETTAQAINTPANQPETQTEQPSRLRKFLNRWLTGENSWLGQRITALHAVPKPDEPQTIAADETTESRPIPEIDADDNIPTIPLLTIQPETSSTPRPAEQPATVPNFLDSEEYKSKPVQRLNLTVSSLEQKTARWAQEERNKKQKLAERAFNFHADQHISADDYLARTAKLRTANNQLQEPDSNTTAPDNSTIEPELT